MGSKVSEDLVSVRAEYAVRVAESAMEGQDWKRAHYVIRALSKNKLKLDYRGACANCGELVDLGSNLKFFGCCHFYCLNCLEQILLLNLKANKFTISCPNCTEGHVARR